jgi:hypothetical protein
VTGFTGGVAVTAFAPETSAYGEGVGVRCGTAAVSSVGRALALAGSAYGEAGGGADAVGGVEGLAVAAYVEVAGGGDDGVFTAGTRGVGGLAAGARDTAGVCTSSGCGGGVRSGSGGGEGRAVTAAVDGLAYGETAGAETGGVGLGVGGRAAYGEAIGAGGVMGFVITCGRVPAGSFPTSG